MEALIIYTSVHHVSHERVARVIANVLNADLLQSKQAATSMSEHFDLTGFGSAICFGKYRKNLLAFADKLPVIRSKRAFTFSTSGLRKIRFIHNSDKPLKAKLRPKGFDIFGEFSCLGLDTYRAAQLVGGVNRGRPNTEDLSQAEDFAKRLKNFSVTNLWTLFS